ncbi:hypothetical protein ASU33_15380 [Solirubrum puertoriconensis]|uniref:Uncharacterized protein n=2 Tax=Solirubrum puertoriconensis TaxID=1751427 RepID=A0A9X0HKP9_SOLP1|nr:hypothetical protein ASU33_15380 [Solirubrum puertoriconensis]
MQSPDGRWLLTNDELTLEGHSYSLLELEQVSVQPVRWLLWIMVGGLVLGGFTLAFLQNWIRTPTAMLGMGIGALLLAWGRRGAIRIRLHRLGREEAHHALGGELQTWQPLASETNVRIYLRHQRAAAEAMALLAAEQAAAAAEAAEFGPDADASPSIPTS